MDTISRSRDSQWRSWSDSCSGAAAGPRSDGQVQGWCGDEEGSRWEAMGVEQWGPRCPSVRDYYRQTRCWFLRLLTAHTNEHNTEVFGIHCPKVHRVTYCNLSKSELSRKFHFARMRAGSLILLQFSHTKFTFIVRIQDRVCLRLWLDLSKFRPIICTLYMQRLWTTS